MPENPRTYAQLIALLPDNTTGLISPEDLRDLVKTLEQLIKAHNDTERGTVQLYGPDSAAALELFGRGSSLRLRPAAGAASNHLLSGYTSDTDPNEKGWIGGQFEFVTNAWMVVSGDRNPVTGRPNMLSVGADVALAAEFGPSSVAGARVASFCGPDKVEKTVIMPNGDIRMPFGGVGRGLIFGSPDGVLWLGTLDNSGALVWSRLATLDTGVAQSTPADLTTLISALSVGTIAAYDRRSNVVASGGYVQSWGEARGQAGIPTLARIAPEALDAESAPYWDGTGQLIRFRNSQRLLSAAAAAFAPDAIGAFVYVGSAARISNNAGSSATTPAFIRVTDPTGWSGMFLSTTGNFHGDFYDGGGEGFGRPDSGVAGGPVRRVVIASKNGVTDIAVQVPNQAKVTAANPMDFSGTTGAIRFGGGDAAFIEGDACALLILDAPPSVGDVTALMNWANANHGAVAA